MESTVHAKRIGGIPCMVPNRTDQVDTVSPHWYISYNTHDRRIYGSITTALVLGQMEYFLILDGDHRDGFQKAIDSSGFATRLAKCLQYVRDNKDKLNDKSDPIF